jgi:uncharacterized protein YjbI with pentapeptide repeats
MGSLSAYLGLVALGLVIFFAAAAIRSRQRIRKREDRQSTNSPTAIFDNGLDAANYNRPLIVEPGAQGGAPGRREIDVEPSSPSTRAVTLFQIKRRDNDLVLFSQETVSLKRCLEAAVAADVDLTGADLRRADLQRVSLPRAKLQGADLDRAYLVESDLTEADLSGIDLRETSLWDAERNTAPGGKLPLNTNGGGLSYMHSGIYGMYALQESVRQMRGTAPAQVPGAAAIASGLCETVLITHGESGRSGVGRTRNVVAPTSLAGQFEQPYGPDLRRIVVRPRST